MGYHAKITRPEQDDPARDELQRALGSFRSVMYPVHLDDRADVDGERGLSAEAVAVRRRRRAYLIATSVPEPVIPRWPRRAQVGLILSSSILLWTLCILLVRMLFV
jgi:hypothetical protein